MMELVQVVLMVDEIKEVVELAKSEWQGKQFYRVVMVDIDGKETSRVMSEYEYHILLTENVALSYKYVKKY